ncbi:hypothetical protein AAMO2058_001008300 [Amorphochlora amoebiformis]
MGRKSKTTGKRITKQSKLGRTLMKHKKQQKLVKVGNKMCQEMHVADVEPDAAEGKLQSILERNALDEFLATAVMADKEFKAERRVEVVNAQELENKKPTEEIKKFEPETFEQMRIPKRPVWEGLNLSAEQLDRQEKDSFLEWRRALAHSEEASSAAITPFEKNIEVWRQLWRVVERADVVVQIVDARNPLLFHCEDLSEYVLEMSKRQKRGKKHVLVVNKADFLSKEARELWGAYFRKQNIEFVFWSAQKAAKQLEQEAKDAKMEALRKVQIKENLEGLGLGLDKDGCDGKKAIQEEKGEETKETIDDLDPVPVTGSQTRVLSRAEILQYFETIGLNLIKGGDSERREQPVVTVGMIGYPNVGKSSTVNVLMGEKKVSVSATPGKTKHFQTLKVREGLILCDCPGLVFPTFMRTKAALVTSGVFPIAQLRDYTAAVEDVVTRVTRGQLQKLYGLSFPTNKPVTAASLLNVHARMRGFMKDHGRPDASRSARVILRDYVNGDLLFCHPPPGLPPRLMRVFLVSIQGDTPLPRSGDMKSLTPAVPAIAENKITKTERGREVWGVPVRDYERANEAKILLGGGRGGGGPATRRVHESPEGKLESGKSETVLPLAAGQVDSKTVDPTEDYGLLHTLLDDTLAESKIKKPNTNKKMSKRERKRLRKLNKMNNLMRRDAKGAAKRAMAAGTAGLPASQSANGSVVAVTWDGGASTEKGQDD